MVRSMIQARLHAGPNKVCDYTAGVNARLPTLQTPNCRLQSFDFACEASMQRYVNETGGTE